MAATYRVKQIGQNLEYLNSKEVLRMFLNIFEQVLIILSEGIKKYWLVKGRGIRSFLWIVTLA